MNIESVIKIQVSPQKPAITMTLEEARELMERLKRMFEPRVKVEAPTFVQPISRHPGWPVVGDPGTAKVHWANPEGLIVSQP